MRSPLSSALWRVCLILLLFITQFATLEATKEEISELRRRAIKAYAQIAPCLTSAWIYQAKYGNGTSSSSKTGPSKHTFSFPDDADAEAHFRSVKSALERFHRTARMHTYRHYSGPWIENHFISHFQGKSLLEMHGIIPLFVPWVDNQRTGEVLWGEIFRTLKQLLRPNMIYLAVSQGDIGLAKIGEYFPNILVLSGGGFGHVPVPLIKGELPYREITKWPFPFDQEIGFFGNLHQASRPIMFEIIRREADREGMTHKIAFGPTWMDMMAKSKFNLAPRGFGRSSFRFVEAIQIGRVPVFLYDDVPWVPYLTSRRLDVRRYGFMAGLNVSRDTPGVLSVDQLVHFLRHNVTEAEYRDKHQQVKRLRHHFTYAGVMTQIERFVANPFFVSDARDEDTALKEEEGTSDLRCVPRHPLQEHETLRRF